MSAIGVEQQQSTPVDLDTWVIKQLAAFAPLETADLVILAGILGYEVVPPSAEAA